MSENTYTLISRERASHERLLAENRFHVRSFEGLRVYELNRSIRTMVLNFRDYFYNIARPDNLSGTQFRSQIHNRGAKKGICLHYTAGRLGNNDRLGGVANV